MKPLPQNYDHKQVEKKWQKYWEENQLYSWKDDQVREQTFVIDTPPPTVSGVLHMGHIFSYTQADFVARYQRMKGKDVFYPMGFDDNGLPTERLVEKVKKVRPADLGREKFIEVCEEVSAEARKEFRHLFESVALSVDWKQEYHTISAESRKISQLSFLDLFNKDRAYRKLQPMFWDPIDQTAIAQAEVEDKELASAMNYITFGICEESPSHRLRGEARRGAAIAAEAANVKWKNSEEIIQRAKELRKNTTDVEKLLWSLLKGRQIKGNKFRRQHPIEHYVADFACVEQKLIIELDGGQHGHEENIKKDKERTAFIENKGFKILRFWNNEALENTHGMMQVIWDALPEVEGRSPHPNPPPQEAGEGTSIVIATTRPELLGACVAVFYHPDDKRYNGTDIENGGLDLEDKQAITALFGVKVPLLADENVKIDKGTGLVMCCTFGDETDIVWWRTHDLETRLLLDKYGKIRFGVNENRLEFLDCDAHLDSANTVDINKTIEYFRAIEGKKVSNIDPKSPGAREIMLNLLKDAGLLIKQEPITHAVKCAERSGAPLEILPTYQWFIKILDQKEQLKAKAAQCNWHPEYMRIRINQWIDGLSWDWCISRQRYFGVPFPIWYSKRVGEEGKIILPDAADLPVNPLVDLPKGYSRDEVEGEADVMDTWATSSVSPQLSSKGISRNSSSRLRGEVVRGASLGDISVASPHPNPPPQETGEGTFIANPFVLDEDRHKKLFPADLRPQAHEIIRTWAFYTIVKAHLHEDEIPWKNLMISGWCLAADKSKMSKSKGNVITPVDLIEEKGADVVRFWASTSRLGCDTAFSEDVLKIGRKLVTKLWNATKFAAIHLDKLQEKPGTALQDVERGVITEPLDLWILTRLKRAVKIATQEFDKYEYCDARVAVEDFFWNDFCDNYLELVKGRVYGEAAGVSKEAQKSAVYTIYHCLDGILRLFAPIVPHITDELYTHIFDDKVASGSSIHARGNWPDAGDYPENTVAEAGGIAVVSVLNAVRKLKAERNVSIKWPLNFIAINGEGAAGQLAAFVEDLKNVTSAAEIVFEVRKIGQWLACKTDDGRFEVVAEFGVSAGNGEVV